MVVVAGCLHKKLTASSANNCGRLAVAVVAVIGAQDEEEVLAAMVLML